MKKITQSFSYGKKLLVLCLFLCSLSGFAQNFTVSLANPVQTSPSTFEVDVVLTVNAPVAGIRLASVAFGINYNTAILNGAAPCTTANSGGVGSCLTWTMVPGSRTAAVNGLNQTTNTNRAVSGTNLNSTGHLRATMTNLTAAASIDITPGTYVIGRYKFANTLSATDSTPVPFTTNSNANLWIQPTNTGGTTNTIVSFYPFGGTTPLSAYTTTNPVGGTGLTLSHTSVAPLSLPLNVGAVCATSGTAVVTPETCAGLNNGYAVVTLSPVPTDLDASFVLDGGSPVTGTLTAAGEVTISGLAPGPHAITITTDGCATPITVNFTVTTNPNVTPTFTQVPAICAGGTLSALPTTSNNSITGTWAPALDNTTTTTYTFTPDAGQCANTTTMTITVNPNVTPTFTQVADICSGGSLTALPTTSNNSITGTWAPALDNTTTTTYTFTPDAGQCATTATMTITVNPNVTPTFTQVASICTGGTLNPLPTTSNNSITGTWAPALDNTTTTTYTFTPDAGQCATTATMTISVNSTPATPTFTQVADICSGGTLTALPTTSNNSITGTWAPALDNTTTTTYTFTPDAGQCATTATMTITVNPNVTPTFTQVADICSGGTLTALPTTSNNSITGTWAPALDNTTTTTYTFTPDAGQCATTTTMTITVNPNTTNGSITTSACDSYTWAANGVTYTTSQTNLTFVSGCNTATLNLTINNSTSGTTTATACDTYTWAAPLGNGNTYTTSQTGLTFVSTNAAGCPNTQTLELTINNSTSGTTTATACDTYTWAAPLGNGNTYTTSQTGLTFVSTNAAGCPNTQTLELTINSSTSGTTNATACDTYTWAAPLGNGNTYTTSQTGLTFISTNAAGCPNTQTLELTINNSTSGTTTATACDTYTWAAPLGNGNTYTTSQTGLTFVSTNAAGCPNTQTLELTINNSTSGTTTATACDTYTWAAPLGNGNTYTSSQTGLTFVSTNAAGCPNTQTLDLTITPSTTNGSVTTAACDSYTWAANGVTYTTSQAGVTHVVGCNTATLNLTINTTAAPTGSNSQSFNVTDLNDVTIADLVVTPSTGIIWYGSLADAQSGTNPLATTTVLTNGSTYWAVNVANGCPSAPFAVTVSVTLGNDDFDNLSFTFYPNPTASVLNISYSKEISEVQVTNLLGQVVMTNKTNNTAVQLDLSNLASAAYFVKVTADGKSKIVKVIKKD